jgi:hypothetical protein
MNPDIVQPDIDPRSAGMVTLWFFPIIREEPFFYRNVCGFFPPAPWWAYQ